MGDRESKRRKLCDELKLAMNREKKEKQVHYYLGGVLSC